MAFMSRFGVFIVLSAIVVFALPIQALRAHDCALVVSRDDASPPKLHVNGPSNHLNGDEAIELLPGDGQFAGMWAIDAPGISTMLKDGDVRGRFRLRAGHRLALRLVSADAGYCLIEPSTWTPMLHKPGDTYPFVQPEPGSFGMQMVSRTTCPQPCRATFRFVDLAGLHAESAPFTLRFQGNPLVAVGRPFARIVPSIRSPVARMGAYAVLPAIMAWQARDAPPGQVLAADGHLHGAPPKWVEPRSFKECVALFRGHMHDLDAEILAGNYSAAALRAPVLRRIGDVTPLFIAGDATGVPHQHRFIECRAAEAAAYVSASLEISARLSDPIGIREEQAQLATILQRWEKFIPAEFICPMRCEGERVYAQEIDCPICGMALSDTRAHMDHRPKHGGTFFMTSDNKHHLEGVLATEGLPKGQREFRVYLYDEFTQPLASDVATARAVLSTPASDEVHQVELRPDAKREYLSNPVPPSLNPVSIKLYVDFKNARGEQLFDFRF